ncbi:MAG: hexosaminidase, partial [Streptomyces sp.]|nr:hexosaminidase [Streptomyces sp.]
MSARRRRAAARRRRPALVAAIAAAAAVALGGAAAATVALWPSGDDGASGAGTPSSGTAISKPPKAAPSTSPSASRSYPLSQAPRTIPAVRDHTPARGPGWRPASGGRVVVGDAGLADEGRLLAGELKLAYAGETDPRDGDVELDLNSTDANAESYTLTVKNRRVTISAPAQAGVFYGTRTLKQEVHDGGTAPEGEVRDQPAKPRRGFMLDIARKHFTAGWIEDRVRELGDLKFNELGLHFSDDQGFRIQSDSHPEIVSKEHLTKDEVRRIVALAESRHLTVVPEIDSPGHLGAVIAAHPDLQLRNAQGVATRGAVDISKQASADIVDDLLNEYAGLFPGGY